MSALLAASTSLASPIKVEFDGVIQQRNGQDVTIQSGHDIRIQVNGSEVLLILPGETPLLTLGAMVDDHSIRIFDAGASSFQDPTDSIGKVVIEGSVESTSTPPTLYFMVKSEAGFPSGAAQTIFDRGCVRFGFPQSASDPERGLIIRNPDPNYPNDDSLARRTRFAAGVLDEITGSIRVGPPDGAVPLGITGDITALRGKIGSVFTTGPIGTPISA